MKKPPKPNLRIPLAEPVVTRVQGLDVPATFATDRANLQAVAALYRAAQLEEARVFQVADRVVQAFLEGTLPVSGTSAQRLYTFHQGRPNRVSERERRGVYARTFGFTTGAEDEPSPNLAFAVLWQDVLTQANADSPGAAAALRALLENLTVRGYGTAQFLAVELTNTVQDITDALSDPGVCAAYGARNFWTLIERVSTVQLGGAPNLVYCRARGTHGSNFLLWIADHAGSIANGSVATDAELRAAAAAWLATLG